MVGVTGLSGRGWLMAVAERGRVATGGAVQKHKDTGVEISFYFSSLSVSLLESSPPLPFDHSPLQQEDDGESTTLAI